MQTQYEHPHEKHSFVDTHRGRTRGHVHGVSLNSVIR